MGDTLDTCNTLPKHQTDLIFSRVSDGRFMMVVYENII